MPVEKDFSLVADSTVSTSPTRDFSPLPIKRPTRTYGRRKSPSPEPASPSQEISPNSTQSVHRTAPPGLRDCVPASSDGEQDGDDQDDSRRPLSSPGKGNFDFGWRNALADIDKQFEDNEDDSETLVTNNTSESGFGKPTLLSHQESDQSSVQATPLPSPTMAPVLVNDLFGHGSRSSLPPSSDAGPSTPPSSFGISHSLQIQGARRRVSKRALVHDSDSELEQPSASPLTNTSPADLHPINTPKSRSSSTPPTSDDGMNTLILPKSKGKGKIKSIGASRPTVPPLELTQSPSSERRTSRKDEGQRKHKHKAPTKKDQEETNKARVRLAVEKDITIPRQNTVIHSKQRLFEIVGASRLPAPQEPSDPIEAFSSSEPQSMSTPAPVEKPAARTPPSAFIPRKVVSIPDFHPSVDSDDDDLPDAIDIIHGMKREDDKVKRQQELMEQKRRALAAQQQRLAAGTHDDDDDDLEIVPSNSMTALKKLENEHFKYGQNKVSGALKIQLNLAGVKIHQPASTKEAKTIVLSGRDLLNASILGKSRQEQLAVINNKKQEWIKIGGKLQEMGDAQHAPEVALGVYVERGLKAAESRDLGAVDDEDQQDGDDGSDADWEPELRGSASPEPGARDADDEVDEDITMVNESGDGDALTDEGDEENLKFHSRRRAVIESDEEENEENDENAPPSRSSRVYGFRKPTILRDSSFDMDVDGEFDHLTPSTDDRMDDGTDKENNTKLMFDRSEDKENRAVVRFEPSSLTTGSSSSSSLQGITRGISLNLETADTRRPFQDLIDPGSPRASNLGPSNLTQIFEAQLSASRRTPDVDITLVPFIDGTEDDEGPGGFSQFPGDDEAAIIDGKLLLKSSFTDLFVSGTEPQKSGTWSQSGDLAEPFTGKVVSNKLRNLERTDTLALTQDIRLQPAFGPSEDVLRKADIIFEKEQEYVLEAAFKHSPQKSELYVNDYGFLTQTRPDVSSPEVYRPPTPTQLESQRSTLLLSPMDTRLTQRSPLRTFSMSDPTQLDSPEGQPLRRLRKRSESPSERAVQFNLGTKRRNAFDVLQENASVGAERQKRRKLDKNEFIEAEAEESDDENGFGFLPGKKDGNEEEEGEDQDKTLETLVDDQEMDEETVAENLVREKYKEHEALDDKEVEERAQAVIRGEKRLRRREHGVLVDDSDDDDDDDENRRLRRQMRHYRKNREDVQALEANPETKSFAEGYKATLIDDDENEFAHLTRDSTDLVLASLDAPEEEEYEKDEEEGEQGQEYLSSGKMRQLVRERAPHSADEDDIDFNDTTWIDMDEDEQDDIEIKTLKPRVKKPSRPRKMGLDPSDTYDALDDGLGHPSSARVDEHRRKQEQSWVQKEGRNRNSTTPRTVGGAAVTGLTRTKSGGSMPKSTKTTSNDSSTTASKPLKSGLSMIAQDRSSRFS